MSDINIDDDDPFAVLGVTPTTPIQEIETRATQLNSEHDSNDVIAAINDAYQQIENGPHVTRIGETTIEPLVIDVDKQTAEVGTELPVSVVDVAGNPIENVTLSADSVTKDHTDATGTGTVPLTDTGTVPITATKPHPKDGFEYRSQTIEITVSQRERHLVFASCPETASVGETIPIQITDRDGDGIGGVTVQTPHSTAPETDNNGCTTLSLSETGSTIEVIASKRDSSNQVYHDATTTIDVTERSVSLTIAGLPVSTTLSEPVQFRIVDDDGRPVPDAEVTTDTSVQTTDSRGRVTVQFDTLGQTVITASKPSSAAVSYESAWQPVTVREQKSLVFDLLPQVVTKDETVAVHVTDSYGRPVSGVDVDTEHGTAATTGDQGRAYVRFGEIGTQTITATKSATETTAYKTATQTVSVERAQRTLEISDGPREVTVNETVRYDIVDDKGEPVPNVTVETQDGTAATTDEQGRAYVRFGEIGDRTLTVTKSSTDTTDYETARQTVTVTRQQQSLQLDRVPETVRSGESIEVRVTSDGVPVQGARVRIEPADTYEVETAATTNASGVASIACPSTGTKRIIATKQTDRETEYILDRAPMTVRRSIREIAAIAGAFLSAAGLGVGTVAAIAFLLLQFPVPAVDGRYIDGQLGALFALVGLVPLLAYFAETKLGYLTTTYLAAVAIGSVVALTALTSEEYILYAVAAVLSTVSGVFLFGILKIPDRILFQVASLIAGGSLALGTVVALTVVYETQTTQPLVSAAVLAVGYVWTVAGYYTEYAAE